MKVGEDANKLNISEYSLKRTKAEERASVMAIAQSVRRDIVREER